MLLSSHRQPGDHESQGNFHKCGDEMPTPHFLTWNHVSTHTHTPDFHRKEDFEEILFL
ncbi:carbohydrate-binding family 9-like protein [Chitinophaga sp. MD30]|uniref:carbohydrate-binding family 9-like protein n=1 Tax=Chitinophaga sp. MD30 TaxID=2033437 RepID=UPI00350EF935